MNEKLNDLAKQAGISILYEYDGYDGHAAVANLKDIEKFAELILAEALDIIKPREGDAVLQYQWLNFYQKRDRLNEHFGTEYGTNNTHNDE
jgi:fructose-specific phosphotransferase system component IIB